MAINMEEMKKQRIYMNKICAYKLAFILPICRGSVLIETQLAGVI